jgi:hypothetical protein
MNASRRRRVAAGLAASAFAFASAACAAGYVVRTGVGDSQTLQLERDGRAEVAPKTEPEQDGFGQARVSADGRTVGWVALTAGCCTSYPLPTVLVLYRDGRAIRRFDDGPPTWHWAFVPGRDEVVTQQALAHGPEAFLFTRRRIADGRTLATYRCNQDEKTPAPRPAWARVIAQPCPAYMPPMAAEPASAPP